MKTPPKSKRMNVLKVKPLTANRMWKGRRFATNEYKAWREECLWLLPNLTLPPAPYELEVHVYLESVLADLDNPIKSFIDVLQKKYGFNDRDVDVIHAYRHSVRKGNGKFVFRITTADRGEG